MKNKVLTVCSLCGRAFDICPELICIAYVFYTRPSIWLSLSVLHVIAQVAGYVVRQLMREAHAQAEEQAAQPDPAAAAWKRELRQYSSLTIALKPPTHFACDLPQSLRLVARVAASRQLLWEANYETDKCAERKAASRRSCT